MSRSRIGTGAVLRGKMTGAGEVELLGEFHGALDLDGTLVVGEGARAEVEGTVRRIEIHGEVRGSVRATEAAFVSRAGVWAGEGIAASLTTEPGARLDGRFRVRPNDASRANDHPE